MKPLVVITGAAGDIGSALDELRARYGGRIASVIHLASSSSAPTKATPRPPPANSSALRFLRGPIRSRYGDWNRYIV